MTPNLISFLLDNLRISFEFDGGFGNRTGVLIIQFRSRMNSPQTTISFGLFLLDSKFYTKLKSIGDNLHYPV